MNTERRVFLWTRVAALADGTPITVGHVSRVAASVAGTDSVALVLWLTSTPREMLFASDTLASAVEEMALTVGEGPCADACAGSLVLVPDLATAEYAARWPVFTPAAVAAGVRAVFSLPLRIGGIRLGSMNLYRQQPGGLAGEQLSDALALADAACLLLLDSAKAVPGGPELPGDPPRPWDGPRHPEVHQATGMITVQLGVTAAVAFARLRAYAFAHDRRLRDVARDVVNRRLRFDAGTGGNPDDN
ncbi:MULTISPECIES: ANTAR domain-containing protein [Catenuloplanes]|uniref:GAF domain-containing protein n=1 Tax=Catenuloplanes niger TaxID=587534 RepID=A0AAE4CS27_9ACTN|nr:ANTAR domain-containing protein [Catenuloplanes niger]MDR7322600.1 GAF domain-containing protein [Catenuloplanes niger]